RARDACAGQTGTNPDPSSGHQESHGATVDPTAASEALVLRLESGVLDELRPLLPPYLSWPWPRAIHEVNGTSAVVGNGHSTDGAEHLLTLPRSSPPRSLRRGTAPRGRVCRRCV